METQLDSSPDLARGNGHRKRRVHPDWNGVFPTGIASEITGIRSERLQIWHQNGLLAPSVAALELRPPRRGAKGRPPGSPNRRYGLDDLVQVLVVRELFASGLSLERVRAAVAVLKNALGDKPPCGMLLGSPFRLVVFRSGEARLLSVQRWSASDERPQAVVALSRTVRITRELVADWKRRCRARAHARRARSVRVRGVYARLPGNGAAREPLAGQGDGLAPRGASTRERG